MDTQKSWNHSFVPAPHFQEFLQSISHGCSILHKILSPSLNFLLSPLDVCHFCILKCALSRPCSFFVCVCLGFFFVRSYCVCKESKSGSRRDASGWNLQCTCKCEEVRLGGVPSCVNETIFFCVHFYLWWKGLDVLKWLTLLANYWFVRQGVALQGFHLDLLTATIHL